ncbi:MAG TPA: NHL repeat-containing protein, partial [Candidatus Ozemobacteraceae bacterium]|nr:NHL repeat-containing protein [Candidatus Ozemobacteraceae bacterium]
VLLVPFATGCGREPHMLNRPTTLRLTGDETRLLILDTGNRRILISDLDFRNSRELRIPGVDPTEFPLWGLEVTGPSEFAVANRTRGTPGGPKHDADLVQISQILFFDFDGNQVHRIVWEGRDRALQFPLQLQALPGGDLIVADGDTARLTRVRRDGQPLATFGRFGRKNGELHFPQDICLLPDGNMLIVDTFNSCLRLFGPDGTFLRTVVEAGEEEGRVRFPQFVCRDRAGNFYCSELETMRVSVFDADWRFRKALVPRIPDASAGKGRFFQLGGLAYAESRRELLVADAFHSCIHVFDADGNWVRATGAVHR